MRLSSKIGCSRPAAKWPVAIGTVIVCVGFFFVSGVMAHYLNAWPELLFHLALFAIAIASAWWLFKRGSVSKAELAVWLVFGSALSLAIVLGFHIVITGSTYAGTVAENYIAPYGLGDVLAFACCAIYCSLVSMAAYSVLKHSGSKRPRIIDVSQPSALRVLLFAVMLFALFLPYLLAYYPGLVFLDSAESLNQIMSGMYNNHHPFIYTMLIKSCVDVAGLFGLDITAGCALYSVVQMTLMSLCLSYLVNWVAQRAGLRLCFTFILTAVVGLCPYIATYSIAMWKDPLFSCAVVIVTLLLADFGLSKGAVASSKLWIVAFSTMLVLVGLFRSNGIVIVALLVLACVLMLMVGRKCGDDTYENDGIVCKDGDSVQKQSIAHTRSLTAATACALVVCLAVTGPLYSALGIGKAARVEAVGIPLSQMARVVVLGGDMSQVDVEYMDSLLPLDSYAQLYVPTCIDNLKWNESFNAVLVEDPSFISCWLSMCTKNIAIFFEAWELHTFGFWTVNVPLVNTYDGNIGGGVPRNTDAAYLDMPDEYGIEYQNLLSMQSAREVLSLDGWAMPLGVINWFVVWLFLCAALLKQLWCNLSLAPTLGLAASLLLASPIWYWPRYGAAEHFLIPFYVCALYLLIARLDATAKTGAEYFEGNAKAAH